jgi:hypothetical protein
MEKMEKTLLDEIKEKKEQYTNDELKKLMKNIVSALAHFI